LEEFTQFKNLFNNGKGALLVPYTWSSLHAKTNTPLKL